MDPLPMTVIILIEFNWINTPSPNHLRAQDGRQDKEANGLSSVLLYISHI